MSNTTIVQKIAAFKAAKETVRQALVAKGMNVPETLPFEDWADAVTSLTGLDWDGSITSVSIKATATKIRKYVFAGCTQLTSVTIPLAVTTIDANAFTYSSLTSVTFSGRTKAQVQGSGAVVAGYPWGLANGTVITCTDGTITVGV